MAFANGLCAARGNWQDFPEAREDCVRNISSRVLVVFLGWMLLLPAAVRGQEKTGLVETGSSMPEPLYKSWIDEFHKQQPSTDVRYMAMGTADAARRCLAGAGDFEGGGRPRQGGRLG